MPSVVFQPSKADREETPNHKMEAIVFHFVSLDVESQSTDPAANVGLAELYLVGPDAAGLYGGPVVCLEPSIRHERDWYVPTGTRLIRHTAGMKTHIFRRGSHT